MPQSGGLAFGAFRLDVRTRRFLRHDVVIPLKPLQFDILHALVSRSGEVVTKDDLMKAGWGDRIVSEDSVLQAVSRLRSVPGAEDLGRCIETVRRHGYRFLIERAPEPGPGRVDDPDVLVAPHRAFVDGQAAIKTLVAPAIATARATFESLVERHPSQPLYHVGLANAFVLTYESRRASATPDEDLLRRSEAHARQARDLAPDRGEAWATLGFVLDRKHDAVGAAAALMRAVELEPDNWRHWLRLTYACWGQPRLDAARRTLDQVPGCPMAHGLTAMVWVARHVLDRAEQSLDAGLAGVSDDEASPERSAIVALYWLKGLLSLARGDVDQALNWFDRELALESRAHLYARECCAQAWYAIGACRLSRGENDQAQAAFAEALARVPGHPMAVVGLETIGGVEPRAGAGDHADMSAGTASGKFEVVMAHAARLVRSGATSDAVRLLSKALAAAPPGSTGWLIPLDPLLGVWRTPDAWAPVLRILMERAR